MACSNTARSVAEPIAPLPPVLEWVSEVEGRGHGLRPGPLAALPISGAFVTQERINIAIVGLGFGSEFIPIYQRHPFTNMCSICQRTREKLDQVGDAFGVAKRYTSFAEYSFPDTGVPHSVSTSRARGG